MTQSFLPEIPKIDPEKGTNLIAGAASPLWLMFGGAAMAGATWWWWSSRWRDAVNVEAFMAPGLALKALPAPEPAPEPTPELTPDMIIDPVTEALVLAPVGLEPEPVVEAAAEAARETLDAAEAVVTETVEAVEAVAAPIVEAAAEAAKTTVDDLTVVVGIGPKLAASLAELGVTRFSEIAAWGPEELADFDLKLNLKGRAERDAWVAQAKRLAGA